MHKEIDAWILHLLRGHAYLAAIIDSRPVPDPMSSACTSLQPAARFSATARLMAASYASLRWLSSTCKNDENEDLIVRV